MKSIYIERTDQSLEVNFSESGVLLLKGISTPDHVNRFFEPLFDWVKIYKEEGKNDVKFEMFIDYLNTSSTRVLTEFISLVSSLKEKEFNVEIVWKYDEDDEDMLELGEDLSLISEAKFVYKGVEVDF